MFDFDDALVRQQRKMSVLFGVIVIVIVIAGSYRNRHGREQEVVKVLQVPYEVPSLETVTHSTDYRLLTTYKSYQNIYEGLEMEQFNTRSPCSKDLFCSDSENHHDDGACSSLSLLCV
jgi:hypothetical protein